MTLPEKAKKATPGPWKRGSGSVSDIITIEVDGDPNPLCEMQVYGGDFPLLERDSANANHIASCDPDTILELLTLLEEAVKVVEFYGERPVYKNALKKLPNQPDHMNPIVDVSARARAFLQKVKGVRE